MTPGYEPKVHWKPEGAPAARCGRGYTERSLRLCRDAEIITTAVWEEVTCQQCINLATVGTWSPTRKRGVRVRYSQ